MLFQPTPPTRTETAKLLIQAHAITDFNPLRPRGRRHITNFKEGLKLNISTHSAHEDGDQDDKLKGYIDTDFNPLRPRGRRPSRPPSLAPIKSNFNPLRPRGRRQQYYTKKPTILHHISTIKSHHTPSNHRQPTLHTSKTVLIVQFFRCESPRKFMFASGSHQTI